MSKRDFIELANVITAENHYAAQAGQPKPFNDAAIQILARFCKGQNYNFMKDRWLDYIAGECGPNGGAIKKDKAA